MNIPETTKLARRALVLGGSRGIGRACIEELNSQGYKVTSIARSHPSDFPHPHVALDVTDFSAVSVFFQNPLNIPDILVFCVGSARKDSILDVDVQFAQESFVLNCASAFIPVRMSYESMRIKRWGRVILVSSILSIGEYERLTYSVSKAALEAIVTSCAEEFARNGVTINAILPGPTDTELFSKLNPVGSVERRTYIEQIPAGRICRPSEVAKLVAWLVDDAGEYVTGQRIRMDGGLRV